MSSSESSSLFSKGMPLDILMCPLCGSDLTSLHCQQCQSQFFSLGEIPCLFPSGLQQKALWQHQAAVMHQQGLASLEAVNESLLRYDLTRASRDRLEVSYKAMEDSLQTMHDLLNSAGIQPQIHPNFANSPVDNLSEYYHHILRDWAWDEEPSKWFDTHANDANLQRVLNICEDLNPSQLLVLGAGAGRLSWDLHKAFKPQFTLATDINPLLLASSQQLIKRRDPIQLPELCTYPQIGYPFARDWTMQPPNDPDNLRATWFAMGADVWNMPLKQHSVDTIVTSWLLDVTGGDVRDLIGVIQYLLKPGGTWINTGPLLYSRHIPFDQKYSAEEIQCLAELAGFAITQQTVEETAHLASPVNARFHHEQIWSFRAEARPLQYELKPQHSESWLTPGWLLIHHLPVPKLSFPLCEDHEFVRNVFSLVDGERSIHLISQMMQASMPADVLAKDAVVALFGEALEAMADGKN